MIKVYGPEWSDSEIEETREGFSTYKAAWDAGNKKACEYIARQKDPTVNYDFVVFSETANCWEPHHPTRDEIASVQEWINP